MEPNWYLLEDTECVKYDPCTRINVVLEVLLPRIEVSKNITVHALAKLEAKVWKLAGQLDLDEEGLLKIWRAFRKVGKKGYDDRIEIWSILYQKKMKQLQLHDFLRSYA